MTDPLPRLCQQLAEFQPTLLVSYPSALALLAREKSAGRLPIAPLLVASAGESFTETMRQRIEAGFGLPLRDSYGASEFLYLAFGCAQGWLHVHADWAVLEPVDAAYQPVSPGQPSHTVLLTNLANRVQPLIRYDLGDSVLFRPDPCPCGSPLPAIRVRGREADLLVFRSADDHDMPVLPLALATIIEESPAVHRFQAIQTGPDWLEIRLEVAAEADPAAVWDELASRLDRWLRSLGLANVKVRRSPEGPQADPVSGKLRQVFATWRPEQGDLAVSGTGLDGQAPRTDQVRGL